MTDDKCRHGKPLNHDCGLCDLGPDPREMRQLDTLSKSDFERLGCEDVSGAQLRARVFVLEGLASELALTLEEMMSDLDGLDFVRPIVMIRAQEALESARERLK